MKVITKKQQRCIAGELATIFELTKKLEPTEFFATTECIASIGVELGINQNQVIKK